MNQSQVTEVKAKRIEKDCKDQMKTVRKRAHLHQDNITEN